MDEKNTKIEEIQDEELNSATGGANVARTNVARTNVARTNVARTNVARSLHAQNESEDEGDDAIPGFLLRCPLCGQKLQNCHCHDKQ